ncbi:hypothetical protein BBJ28_00021002 [Nothophytophthora sp. Chile5]|nr:hypothetical protein BBJ28_00021002 [Nothophytophthora sp. Chile5]
MRPAVTSGIFAWLLTYTLTLGNILTGQPPASQSDADFQVMTTLVSTSCHCLSLLVPYAMSLQNLHPIQRPDAPWSFQESLTRLGRRTWWLYFLAQGLAVAAEYAIVSGAEAFAAVYKPHLYTACLASTVHRVGVDEASRSIFQRETVEGVRRRHVNTAQYWKRYVHVGCQAANFTVMAMVVAALVHVSTALNLLSTQQDLMLFSLASVAFKAVVLTVTKRFALKRGCNHLKKIYVLTAVPTVMINTQVRLVMLRGTGSGTSLNGFLLLGLLEPVLRATKVWHLRRSIRNVVSLRSQAQSRVSHRSVVAISPSPRAPLRPHIQKRGPPHSGLTRRGSLLNWRQSLLHFHAAETHADMCSEYIAIACSTSIYFFLRHHSRFGWSNVELHGVGSPSVSEELVQTIVVGCYQVGIEMVVDFGCCFFELLYGVPLHAADTLGGFLTAVFTSCALTSISISAMLSVHKAAPRG